MNIRFNGIAGDYFGTISPQTKQATAGITTKVNDSEYVRLEIQSATLHRLIQERSLVGGELRNIDAHTKTLVRQAMLNALTK